jgi:hypothetical protein
MSRLSLAILLGLALTAAAYEGDGTAYSGDGEKDNTGFNACGFGSIGDHWCVGWRLAAWGGPLLGAQMASHLSLPAAYHLPNHGMPPAPALPAPTLFNPTRAPPHPSPQGEVLCRRARGHVQEVQVRQVR